MWNNGRSAVFDRHNNVYDRRNTSLDGRHDMMA